MDHIRQRSEFVNSLARKNRNDLVTKFLQGEVMSNLVTYIVCLTVAASLQVTVSSPAWSQTEQVQSAAIHVTPSTPPIQRIITPNHNATAQQIEPVKITSAWTAPDPWFIYTVTIIVLLGSLLALRVIGTALSNSSWSLSDALSEEVDITAFETIDGIRKPMMDGSQNPVVIKEMRASMSRVVAMMGMLVIMLMFLGFGTFALYVFAKTGSLPESIDQVVNFLIAGLTLFAPYVVNKFSAVFEGLSPKRT